MFKTTTTKIFLIFASLALIELGLLAYFFGKIVVRETETSVYVALSQRVQISALQAAHKGTKTHLIFSNGSSNQNLTPGFSVENLNRIINDLNLGFANKAKSQTVVTTCQNDAGVSHLCAVSAVPSLNAWAFDAIPKATVFEIIQKLARELASFAFVLVAAALGFTFLFSRWALQPLHKFAKASRLVAKGEFEKVNLPSRRKDEIGELAAAFEKMISDIKEREKNLALSGVKLAHSARLASIGQMGASIAHEVKNPLTSMFGYAKILSQKSSDSETREAAEIIMKEADRCNQILSQMLRFSRNDPHEKRPYAMKEVIQSAVALVKAEAKRFRIEIETELDSDSVLVGSAQQIQQVLLNLLMNAIHASRDALAQNKNEASKIQIRLQEKNGFVHVQIEDHALGIPHAVREKIFDPFFTTKDKREGTGLGLSVALDLIQEQGGSLQFKSEESIGTTFEIKFPLIHSHSVSAP